MQANAKFIPLSKPDRPARSGIRTVDSACATCGSFRCALVLKGKDRDFDNTTSDEFTLVLCTQCGLVYLNPRPATSELGALYPPNYPGYNHEFSRKRTIGMLDERLNTMLSLMPGAQKSTGRRVLHLGAGDGYVLTRLNALAGDKLETHALDVSLQAMVVAAARGHTTYPGFAEEHKLPPNNFDLVIVGHLLQRVTDPRFLLLCVFNCLSPGGIAWLECANTDAPAAQWLKDGSWGGYQIPRNWYLFNRKLIEKLAKESRLELAHIEYSRQGQYFRSNRMAPSARTRPGVPLRERRLLQDFHRPPEAKGQTSNMLIVLKKPS